MVQAAPGPPAFAGLLAVTIAGVLSVGVLGDPGPDVTVTATGAADAPPTTSAVEAPAAADDTVPVTLPDDNKTADQRTLGEVGTITDDALRPKSVVASGTGLFFAQNMMYAHNVAVYDRDLQQVKVIDDSVVPSFFGLSGSDPVEGAPVEAVFTSDGSAAYVSQYKLYGPGQDNPGTDTCAKGDWDDSFLYRIPTDTLAIDQVIPVGPVPKFVAITHDDATVLVSNWCGYDLSVVDTATGTETRRVDIGRFPRGIAVAPDDSVAYVTAMGTSDIAVVDLESFEVSWISDVGRAPRSVALSPDGSSLYVTLNGEAEVKRIDTATRQVTGEVVTGNQPRSMVLSDDGTALYVVNYADDTVSKVRTSDMTELQELPTKHHPIGITYDAGTRRVWVACYVGALMVFDDT
ncbi:MAG: YncE family protein [Microthrixaceae bacterium]|nr:YncE family protein [Microthrixaceae bacterium]